MTDKPRRLRIFGEETVKREVSGPEGDQENPYWQGEEPAPHPNPELGCIRRGLCCKSSPGWFGPGEVEKAAELLDMDPGEFVSKYIVIDSIALSDDKNGSENGSENSKEQVEVFVPVKLDRTGEPLATPGTRVDDLYRMFRSPCVFFENNGCKIYEARPSECARYICTNAPEDNLSHREIAEHWRSGEPIEQA